MNRRKPTLTLLQATQNSPTLARLAELASESRERLRAIQPLLPPNIRPLVSPGPIEGREWCLLLGSNAAAAKLRQMLPALESHLRTKGWDVESIRVKVHKPGAAG